MAFEYKTVHMTARKQKGRLGLPQPDYEELERVLNREGALGWRLVETLATNTMEAGWTLLILERELEG